MANSLFSQNKKWKSQTGQSQPWLHSKILLTKTKNQNQIITTASRDQAGPSKRWLHREPIPAIGMPLWPGDLLNAFLSLL